MFLHTVKMLPDTYAVTVPLCQDHLPALTPMCILSLLLPNQVEIMKTQEAKVS